MLIRVRGAHVLLLPVRTVTGEGVKGGMRSACPGASAGAWLLRLGTAEVRNHQPHAPVMVRCCADVECFTSGNAGCLRPGKLAKLVWRCNVGAWLRSCHGHVGTRQHVTLASARGLRVVRMQGCRSAACLLSRGSQRFAVGNPRTQKPFCTACWARCCKLQRSQAHVCNTVWLWPIDHTTTSPTSVGLPCARASMAPHCCPCSHVALRPPTPMAH